MADNKTIELQHQVRQKALEMQDEYAGLKKFEQEMKSREKAMKTSESKCNVPIRSNVEEFQKHSVEESLKKISISDTNNHIQDEKESAEKRKIADQLKEEGSQFYKNKDFESAAKKYSHAIEVYSEESVYYSNRSQCYINLGRFNEAITDADAAIKLDEKSPKSYYRRMDAYEKLGEHMKALESCQDWMNALPENQLAKTNYDRIHNKIIEMKKQKEKEKIKWSRLSRKASFEDKSPNLQSKKPLKKITTRIKKSNSPIPDCVIDKLFNNNTGEHVPEVETDSQLFKPNFFSKPSPVKSESVAKEKTKINETNEILKATTSTNPSTELNQIPSIDELEQMKASHKTFELPTTGPQFYATWKELSEELKFVYLRDIAKSSISFGKLIGAQLDSTLLSEIIHVTHKYFPHFNVAHIPLLYELSENSELSILALFLDNADKQKINEMLKMSVDKSGDDETSNMIQQIKKGFQI